MKTTATATAIFVSLLMGSAAYAHPGDSEGHKCDRPHILNIWHLWHQDCRGENDNERDRDRDRTPSDPRPDEPEPDDPDDPDEPDDPSDPEPPGDPDGPKGPKGPKDKHPNSGRGNGSEGEPDTDPGNSGGHNRGGD